MRYRRRGAGLPFDPTTPLTDLHGDLAVARDVADHGWNELTMPAADRWQCLHQRIANLVAVQRAAQDVHAHTGVHENLFLGRAPLDAHVAGDHGPVMLGRDPHPDGVFGFSREVGDVQIYPSA